MMDAAAPDIRRRRISPGTDPSIGRICARRVQAPQKRRLNSGGRRLSPFLPFSIMADPDRRALTGSCADKKSSRGIHRTSTAVALFGAFSQGYKDRISAIRIPGPLH